MKPSLVRTLTALVAVFLCLPVVAQTLIDTTAGQGTTAPNGGTIINGNFKTLWPLTEILPFPNGANYTFITLSPTTGEWVLIPECLIGNTLNYDNVGHAFSCNAVSGGAPTFTSLASGANTSAAMVVGSGASLGTTGSGTIAATSVPLSGLPTQANNTLLGNASGGIAVPEVITLGTNLSFTGTTLNATNSGSTAFSALTASTNTGNALVLGNGSSLATTGTGTIAATSLSALSGLPSQSAATLLGNPTGGLAAASPITLGTNLSFSGTTLNATSGLASQAGLTLFGNPSSSAAVPGVVTLGSNLYFSGTTINASNTASTAWSALASGTNTSASMVVGNGASLTATGTGQIVSSSQNCSTNLVLSGVASASNACQFASFNLTGSQTPNTLYSPFYEFVNDASNALGGYGNSIQNGLDYHLLNLNLGWYGLRNPQYMATFINAAPGLGDTSGDQIVGQQWVMKDVGQNLNGRGLNFTDAQGQLWNGDFSLALTSGATNILQTIGLEFDNNIQAGSSVVTNIGVSVNAAANKGARGAAIDAGMIFTGPTNTVSGASNTNTFATLIGFGKANGGDGLFTDGSVLQMIPQTSPQFHQPLANIGVDFRYGSWTTAPYVSNNAEIDGSGNIYGAGLVAGTSGISASSGTLASVAVTSPGAYWNQASFPGCTVSAPPSGTTATCTVTSMGLTQVSMPLVNASFAGYISGASGNTATLNIVTVHGNTVLPSSVSLGTTGWVLDSGFESSQTAITAGSGLSWTITCASACSNVALAGSPIQMQAVYAGVDSGCTNGSTATLAGDTGTEPTISLQVASSGILSGHVIGATILTAGSVTAKAAVSTTTGGGCSVQPTWADFAGNSSFGWGVLTVSNTAGSGYPLAPPPLVYLSTYSSSRTMAATLTPTMTNATAAINMTSPVNLNLPASVTLASPPGLSGYGMTGSVTAFTDSTNVSSSNEALYAFPASTYNCASACTPNYFSNVYIPAPSTGGNVTATYAASLLLGGNLASLGGGKFAGLVSANLGITVAGAAANLDVAGTSNVNILTGASTGAAHINDGTGSGTITIGNSTHTGNTVLAGLTTGTNADFLCLSSGGVVLIQASSCTISSRRFKSDIGIFEHDAIAELLRLKVSTYRMTDLDPVYIKGTRTPIARDPNYNRPQIGLIAENVAEVEPKCAIYENDLTTPKSYRPECVTAMLVKAVQEQHAIVRANKWQVDALQRRLDKQQIEIAVLAVWCLSLTVGFGFVLVRRR